VTDAYDVAIVGAGAAGLMTAITAAREAPPLRIALLEGTAKPGTKILVSGGGRCNVTNRTVKPADFHGADRKLIARVLGLYVTATDRTISRVNTIHMFH
jgi:predicted flavoprotein YhiN